MLVRVKNTLHLTAPFTSLTNTEVSGTNVLRWANPSGFGASWAVQVGEIGEEQSETVTLGTASPSGTAGTLSANTLYAHAANTPLYGIKYSQVVFKRSITGTSGSGTILAGGSVTYQPDSEYTIFDDTTGSASYTYKVFYQSSAGTTIDSDWIYPVDANEVFYSMGAIRSRIRDKMWDSTFIPNDRIINNWINEWRDEMTNAVISVNEDYALGTVGVAFGTSGLGTVTTGDFKQPRRIWITYNGIDKFQSTKMTSNSMLPGQVFSNVHPYHAWYGDNTFQVFPAESGGTAEVVFYRFGTTMVNDTDELAQPFKSYSKSFVDYGLAQAAYKEGKLPEYQNKIAEAMSAKEKFVLESSPRDKTGPTMVQVVEPLGGEDEFWP
jgi:hypothetical protein